MNNISKIKYLSFWVFIVPLVTINLCLFVVIYLQEYIPHGVGIAPTFPYFDGGTSISRTARNYPTWLIFKPGMIITAILLIRSWNLNKKLMVSNGKSLVIKNKNINQYYVYPLNRTPLNLILDKKYLINKIKNLNSRIIENKYVNFTIINDKYEINIFFDLESLNLIGWQTEDIYQNLAITFISNVKLNQKISEDIFKLPKRN